MSNSTYLALLRGINVGGNNIIKMADLRAAFEEWGYSDVRTYIQSGNVIFTSDKKQDAIRSHIHTELKKRYGLTSPLFILSEKEWKKIAEEAPKDFGKKPDLYRYDVIVCDETLKPKDALKEIELREGVDQASAGTHALYFTRLIEKSGKSYLSKVVSLPMYKHVTIRNWNTTVKLQEMMQAFQ